MEGAVTQMSEKDTAYAKAVATASGCQTREQLESARQYVRQYTEKYGDGPECAELWRIIKAVDERLFPPSQRPLPDGG